MAGTPSQVYLRGAVDHPGEQFLAYGVLMARTTKSGFLFGLLFLVTSSCISVVGPLRQKETSLLPAEAERQIQLIFAEFSIPVAERRLDSRVRSGKFNPMKVWGVMALERVQCGADPNADPKTAAEPYELEVVMTIRDSARGSTRVSLESYGRGRSPGGEEKRCSLTTSFQNLVLSAVPDAGNSPRGWGIWSSSP